MRRWFAGYCRRFLAKNFHAVRIAKSGKPMDVDPATPLVIYLNHPSWWDPLICFTLTDLLWPVRRHFAPIDTAMLERYRLFAKLGFFGVEPRSRRGGMQLLRTGGAILSTPGTCLWITAQGRFADVRERPVTLEEGLSHLLQRSPNAVVLPLAIEYPFWGEREPEALLRFGPATSPDRLAEALAEQMDRLAEDAMSREAARFEILLAGKVGTSRTYDTWRRMKAMVGGQKFSAAHLDEPQA